MRKEDISQISEIDREAFPSQWPPPNYHHELELQLAHYIVATDEARIPKEAQVKPEKPHGSFTSRVKRWFKHNSFLNHELPAVEKRGSQQ